MLIKEIVNTRVVKHALATGKAGQPGQCFRNVVAPSVPDDQLIGYGTVSDGKETVPHAFFLDDQGNVHEPTIMKDQKYAMMKGSKIDHLTYTINGSIKKKDLKVPPPSGDGTKDWKQRELAIAKLAGVKGKNDAN